MLDNDENVTPETEPEGRLGPPPRKPPTAIGAETPRPDDDSRKVIVVPEFITLAELGRLIHVPPRKIMWVAFNRLGKLVTFNQPLPFDETQALVAQFGYTARPAGE